MRKLLTLFMIGGLMTASISFSTEKKVWKGYASLTIKAQHLKAFKKAVAKITTPTRNEAGCIFYEGYQVLNEIGEETNIFEFHEIWTTKEAMLIDHKENSSHMKLFFKEIKADTADTFIEKFIVNGKYVNILN